MHVVSADQPLSGRTRFVITSLALMMALTVLATYTFLHESGHALLGLLFGGRMTSFSINFWNLSAHVGLEGDFSAAQRALVLVGGVGLPLLAFAGFVAFIPRRTSASLEVLRFIAAFGVLNTLLPWIFIPLLYLAGRAPGDDVTNLLRISQAPPILVAALALVLYVAGWLCFFRRIGGIRPAWERWRQALPGLLAPNSIRDFRSIAAAGLMVMAVSSAANIYTRHTTPLSLPPGYEEVARITLAEKGLDHDPVHRFTLEQPGQVSLHFLLENVQTGPAEISLVGPDGDHTFFKIGQNAKIGRATVNPKDLPLSAGEYRVELTFPRQAGGQVVVHVKGVAVENLSTTTTSPQ